MSDELLAIFLSSLYFLSDESPTMLSVYLTKTARDSPVAAIYAEAYGDPVMKGVLKLRIAINLKTPCVLWHLTLLKFASLGCVAEIHYKFVPFSKPVSDCTAPFTRCAIGKLPKYVISFFI